MTHGSNGEHDTDEALPPQEEARLRAALGALGEPRGAAELDDAAMLARVLAGARREPAPPPRSRPRARVRRGMVAAVAAAAIVVAALAALAAQGLFTPAPAPPGSTAPEASAPGSAIPGGNGGLRSPAPSPTDEPPAPASSEPSAAPPSSAAASASAAPSQAAPAKDVAAGPEALLSRAQERLAAGDTPGAVAAYRALVASHPGSAQARAALITLGQLALRGGRAGEALGHFDRYLAGGGPLAIEARVGRIGALRALGRTGDERAAITDFLSRHGDGMHAARLRARLAELSGR